MPQHLWRRGKRPRGDYAKIQLELHGCEEVEIPPAFTSEGERFAVAGNGRVEIWHLAHPLDGPGPLATWELWVTLAAGVLAAAGLASVSGAKVPAARE